MQDTTDVSMGTKHKKSTGNTEYGRCELRKFFHNLAKFGSRQSPGASFDFLIILVQDGETGQ